MRFITTLLPLVTLAVRVAAAPPADPSRGDNIELQNIEISYPNATYQPPNRPPSPSDISVDRASAQAPVRPNDIEAQREPCPSCLEKAKAAVAKATGYPKDVLIASKHVVQAAQRNCCLILVGCVIIAAFAAPIAVGVYEVYRNIHDKHELCGYRKGHEECVHVKRRDESSLQKMDTCLHVECGPEDCGTASHTTTKNPSTALDGGHVKGMLRG